MKLRARSEGERGDQHAGVVGSSELEAGFAKQCLHFDVFLEHVGDQRAQALVARHLQQPADNLDSQALPLHLVANEQRNFGGIGAVQFTQAPDGQNLVVAGDGCGERN